MTELAQHISDTLEESAFLRRCYPALIEWGVQDRDVLVHSIGCSVWNALGNELGYMAVVEGPAPVAVGNDIRSDSVWFDKSTRQPEVLVEFERYDGSDMGKAKLDEKLGNLMEAAVRWEGKPKLLVLSAWSKGVVSAPDVEGMEQKLRSGMKNSKGVRIQGVKGCVLLFSRFIFDVEADGLLRLKRMMFSEFA